MNFKTDVIVIGAGQAGLAASYFLQMEGIQHVVLEREKIGSSWIRQRWDSFKMNTPNWMTWLPGMKHPEVIKDQFMTRNEFVTYLRRYVNTFQLPVKEHSKVTQIFQEEGRYHVTTVNANCVNHWNASAIIIASGMMNHTKFPAISANVPQEVLQLHSSEYTSPVRIPKGNILVIGGAQSGCQIAEELAIAGRTVYLASSSVPRAPRRYKGKDIMEWMQVMGLHDITAIQLRDNPKLGATQPQSSGIGSLGHTVSYQSLNKLGVKILGSLSDIKNRGLYYLGLSYLGSAGDFGNGTLRFAENAEENIRFADEASAEIKKAIDKFLDNQSDGIVAKDAENDEADFPDVHFKSASGINMLSFDLDEINTIIWATGFGYDFSFLPPSWLNKDGTPIHTDGKIKEGVYCLGFPWLRKKKSGLVHGVREDAEFIVTDLRESLSNRNK